MSRHSHKADGLTYFIAHDPALHNGYANDGEVISTGQGFLEVFTDYRQYLNRYIELGGKPQDAPAYNPDPPEEE